MSDESATASFAMPPETARWRHVERRLLAVLANYGFADTRPPLLEDLPGGATSLRTDAVTSLARLFVKVGPPPPARWSMLGELCDSRPTGVLRYFSYHAAAAASIGLASPDADAELISLGASLATEFMLTRPELRVGTVGDAEESAAYRAMVTEMVKASPRCPVCTAADVLRVLACEEEVCRAVAHSLPTLRMYLGEQTLRHHEQVLARVRDAGHTIVDDPTLAIGGVANHTVFLLSACTTDGTRRTLLVGARRDQLVESVGGPPTPLVGLALGLERTVASMAQPAVAFATACEVYIASQGEDARRWALKAALTERARGFRVEVELRDVAWPAQLERARQLKARVIVLAGQPGRPDGEVTLHHVAHDTSRIVTPANLASELKRLLR